MNVHAAQSYKHLMKMIGSMDVTEEQKARFTQALRGFAPVMETLVDIAGEFKLEDKLNRVTIPVVEITQEESMLIEVFFFRRS